MNGAKLHSLSLRVEIQLILLHLFPHGYGGDHGTPSPPPPLSLLIQDFRTIIQKLH
jgi:hypothetical protein